jgi:hypothetical protein
MRRLLRNMRITAWGNEDSWCLVEHYNGDARLVDLWVEGERPSIGVDRWGYEGVAIEGAAKIFDGIEEPIMWGINHEGEIRHLSSDLSDQTVTLLETLARQLEWKYKWAKAPFPDNAILTLAAGHDSFTITAHSTPHMWTIAVLCNQNRRFAADSTKRTLERSEEMPTWVAQFERWGEYMVNKCKFSGTIVLQHEGFSLQTVWHEESSDRAEEEISLMQRALLRQLKT